MSEPKVMTIKQQKEYAERCCLAADESNNDSVRAINFDRAYTSMVIVCDYLIEALDRIAKTEASRKPGQEWVHWVTQAKQALKEVQS